MDSKKLLALLSYAGILVAPSEDLGAEGLNQEEFQNSVEVYRNVRPTSLQTELDLRGTNVACHNGKC